MAIYNNYYLKIILLCLPLILLSGCSNVKVYDIGERVEDFTLPSLNGDAVSLNDYSGRVIFIEFFNTW
ncbi:thiol-disulfide oxidoreductase [bacterium BMS3Bbin06]|nr:thiol-disulfide oxidoreductase [bacterium BMS3Abin08]GBE33699.1 thiol-disulfide oxidoreductase [bacterium BMS3Bbin06]HDO36855.1 redoxin domain-containing protein [Nitrospirota bacterium]HDY70384.1 redoxin domain-containing protein [Nitrospirota bacterium]